jgi:hypothetical protein
VPEAPKPVVVSPEEARRAAEERLQQARGSLDRFLKDNARLASYLRVQSRVRLYEDNPNAPGATAKLSEERRSLRVLGDISPENVAAYRSRLAELSDALRKAKAEAPK